MDILGRQIINKVTLHFEELYPLRNSTLYIYICKSYGDQIKQDPAYILLALFEIVNH